MTFISTFSIFAAFRKPLRVWAGIGLILFHLINSFIFTIHFFTAPLVLACIFFPYGKFNRQIKTEKVTVQKVDFEGERFSARYTRTYINGDRDFFKGFYALREKAYDNKPIPGGLLYIPFLEIPVLMVWFISDKLQK